MRSVTKAPELFDSHNTTLKGVELEVLFKEIQPELQIERIKMLRIKYLILREKKE